MQLRGKVEIENTSYKVGDVVKVKVVVLHPMDTGFAQDKASGEVVPANYIKKITVYFNDTVITTFDVEVSSSQNPRITFPYKVSGKGVIKVVFEDNKGDKAEKTTEVTPK